MARHLVRSLWFAVLVAAFVLEGCGKPSLGSPDRPLHSLAALTAAADPPTVPPEADRGSKTSERLPGVVRPFAQDQTQDPPLWLAELLHAPDPNVRVQALDAWAQHPGVSLDPVTYALVDPDESVRARAQEVFEQELARR